MKQLLFQKLLKTTFEFFLVKIKSKVKFVIVEDGTILEQAKNIAKTFDFYDYPFIVLSLKLKVPIWTNDKQMIIHGLKTNKYLALDTKAIEDLLKRKSLEEIKEDLKERYRKSKNTKSC